MFLRAAVFGLVAAALAGAVAARLFASIEVAYEVQQTGFLGGTEWREVVVKNSILWWIAEWATPFLLEIVVGAAILYATKGRRSRSYAALAVLLTGGAIILSHIPMVLTVRDRMAPILTRNILTAGSTSTFLLGLIVDTLAYPVLIGANDPVNIVRMLLPSAIALPILWRRTVPDDTAIMGPYSL